MKVKNFRTIYERLKCFLHGYHSYALIDRHSPVFKDGQLVSITEEYKCVFCGDQKTLKL